MIVDIELKKQEFEENGYVKVENLLSQVKVNEYLMICQDLLTGKIDTGKNRSDLGAALGENKNVENITQIMWPSDFVQGILENEYHQRSLYLVKKLLGEDMEMDFDMVINKAPYTNTITPWHQDAAYWVDLPDKRAISCWMALDEATLENGCMWYTPKSHLAPILPHRFAGKEGGALVCDGSEENSVYVPLQPGSCVMHGGNTLHYSRGNSTAGNRRAWIINFRPKAMIELERSKGFDHGRGGNAADRKIRNKG